SVGSVRADMDTTTERAGYTSWVDTSTERTTCDCLCLHGRDERGEGQERECEGCSPEGGFWIGIQSSFLSSVVAVASRRMRANRSTGWHYLSSSLGKRLRFDFSARPSKNSKKPGRKKIFCGFFEEQVEEGRWGSVRG